jgi:hypothetical protein
MESDTRRIVCSSRVSFPEDRAELFRLIAAGDLAGQGGEPGTIAAREDNSLRIY